MTSARFAAALVTASGRADAFISNLAPLRVVIRRVQGAGGKELPYVGPGETAPPEATAVLHVFHLGAREHVPSQQSTGSELIVRLHGFVQQLKSGRDEYELRVQKVTAGATAPHCGWLRLALRDGKGDVKEQKVAFFGGAQAEATIGCVLTTAAGDAVAQEAVPLQLTNLNHVIGSMLAEGGLTLSFHVMLNYLEEETYFRQWLGAHPEAVKNWGGAVLNSKDVYPATGKSIGAIANDDGFQGFGRQFAEWCGSLSIGSLHRSAPFKQAGDELVIASTPFYRSADEIVDGIKQILDKVKSQYPHGKPEQYKVRRLAIMSHGYTSATQSNLSVGRAAAKAHTLVYAGTAEVDQLLDRLKDLLTPDVLITFYACCTARGPNDVDFGMAPAPGRHLGQGSFAEHFARGLHQRGLSQAAVWGHTSEGHGTQNPELRAFTKDGAADLVWMVQSPVPSDNAQRRRAAIAFGGRFPGNTPAAEKIVQTTMLHPGEQVKAFHE